MADWRATFGDLARLGIPLTEWLKFHAARRAMLTDTERQWERW